MKQHILITLIVIGAALTASATVYWRGPVGIPTDWLSRSGPEPSHGWWNANDDGSGAWKDYPSAENVHVKNGGVAVISTDVPAIAKLVLNYNYSSRESSVRVDEGGALICTHAYVSHGSDGAGGILHVNGGSVAIGQTGADSPGLFAPNSTSSGAAREVVLVNGGRLDVYGNFCLGCRQSAHQGALIVSNGTVVSHCNLMVGGSDSLGRGVVSVAGGVLSGDGESSLLLKNGSEIGQTGGFVNFALAEGDASKIWLSGGRSDFGKLSVKCGTRLEVVDDAVLTGGLTVRGDELRVGATNEILVLGGTLNVTNFAGYIKGTTTPYAWILAENPFRFVQTGGSVSLERFFLNAGASHDARFAIDGGAFEGGPVCVFDQPFYFRHSGSAAVVFEKYADNSDVNGNSNGVNCLVEHVIDRGTLAPIHFSTPLGAESSQYFNVFGHNVLRPAGGVQVLTNATVSLFESDVPAAPRTIYSSGMPDLGLWICGRLGKKYVWAATLNDQANVGSAASGETVTFAPTAFGFLSLPSVKTNGLVRYAVSLSLEPKAATLADIARGLNAAGYKNVSTEDDDEQIVAFEIPNDWIADRESNMKLLFDFTETRCPDRFLPGSMTFQVMTNALVKSVALSIDRNAQGLILIVR